jgi:hypothetical protein
MSLAIFGLLLLMVLCALGFKSGRGTTAAIFGVMLGMVIAGNGGPIAGAAHGFITALRSALESFGTSLFGGGA